MLTGRELESDISVQNVNITKFHTGNSIQYKLTTVFTIALAHTVHSALRIHLSMVTYLYKEKISTGTELVPNCGMIARYLILPGIKSNCNIYFDPNFYA